MDMNCPTLTGGSQANGTMGGPVPPRHFVHHPLKVWLSCQCKWLYNQLGKVNHNNRSTNDVSTANAASYLLPQNLPPPPPQAAPAPPRSILHPMAMGNQQPMWWPPPPPQMRPPNMQHPSMPPPSPLNIRPLPPLTMIWDACCFIFFCVPIIKSVMFKLIQTC